MKLLAEWIIKAFILLITTRIVPGFDIDSWLTAFVVALILGVFNIILKPILILLTLPVTILSLGLFIFVINAALLWLASAFVREFQIESFGTAIIASIVISLLSLALNAVFNPKEKNS